eukprot:578138_1
MDIEAALTEGQDDDLFFRHTVIQVADRQWSVVIYSLHDFMEARITGNPLGILLTGIAITIFGSLTFLFVLISLVSEKRRDLERESENATMEKERRELAMEQQLRVQEQQQLEKE